jgi:hypothetical protein
LNVLLLGALQAALDFEGESGEREVENAVGVAKVAKSALKTEKKD